MLLCQAGNFSAYLSSCQEAQNDAASYTWSKGCQKKVANLKPVQDYRQQASFLCNMSLGLPFLSVPWFPNWINIPLSITQYNASNSFRVASLFVGTQWGKWMTEVKPVSKTSVLQFGSRMISASCLRSKWSKQDTRRGWAVHASDIFSLLLC